MLYDTPEVDSREWFDAHWREWVVCPAGIDERAGDPQKAPKGPGVYFLFDGDRIAYIGMAANVRRRLGEHARDRTAPVTRAAVVECPRCWLPHVETYYLRLYRPPLNQAEGYRLLLWRVADAAHA